MSYDINFWKLERPIAESPVEVYRRLSAGDHVPGLAPLPVKEISDRLKSAFPDFDPNESFPAFRTAGGGIEVFSTDQHFRFDLRGECGPEAQKIVEIMAGFGCPLYDPQVDKRYDSEDGMVLGETPNFVKPRTGVKAAKVAEQAATLEVLRQQVLRKIAGKKNREVEKGE